MMAENVLERTEGRVSYHDSVEAMLKRIKEDGLSSVFSRWPVQEKLRCSFCLQGLSCQLCTHGPCRISDKVAGADKGVCGIGPDAMAMRNLLMRNIMGAATYAHHAFEAFRTLKATGEGKTPFTIGDVGKLKWMCEKVGIDPNQETKQLAIQLAELLDRELKINPDQESIMLEAFAPKKRKVLWREKELYPSGVQHEVENSIASCLTNVDGDFVSLARKALRLGIATIYTAQIGLEMVQDILFGTPMPHQVDVDLGIMDPDYVNIVFNGHQPWIGVATLQKVRQPAYQERAQKAGAKGIHIVGSIETGQELVQRFPVDDVFVGLMGNWLSLEPLLATGAVDALVMEENCSPPAIDQYAEKYQFALFYRELGVELNTIKALLTSPSFDKTAALREHHAKLLAKKARLELLIANVEKSIAAAEGRIRMSDQEKFEGFKKKLLEENEAQYGRESREKYGEEAVRRSNQKFMEMTEEQYAKLQELTERLNDTLKQAMATGDPAGDLAQKACALHKEWLLYFWPKYSKEAHWGLAQMYVDGPRFTAYYDQIAPGCAVFLRDALRIYTGAKGGE